MTVELLRCADCGLEGAGVTEAAWALPPRPLCGDHWGEARAVLHELLGSPRESSSWAPVDLEAILDGDQVDEPPELLARTDGVAIFYRGRSHVVAAASPVAIRRRVVAAVDVRRLG